MNRDTTDLQAFVIGLIATYLDADPATIGEDTVLEEELGFDSTELIGIIVDAEAALSISLRGIHYASLKTPRDVAGAIAGFCGADRGALVPA